MILQLLTLPVFSQVSRDNTETTHSLEFLASGANQPVSANITIFKSKKTNKISIYFPDEKVTTEYIIVENTLFKFQISQIKNNKLLTIQFVGTGDLTKKITGKFFALIDGELRDDMSGKFKIKKLSSE